MRGESTEAWAVLQLEQYALSKSKTLLEPRRCGVARDHVLEDVRDLERKQRSRGCSDRQVRPVLTAQCPRFLQVLSTSKHGLGKD